MEKEKLEEFRKFLPGDYHPSDAELESIVNDLTRFAEILVEVAIREQKEKLSLKDPPTSA